MKEEEELKCDCGAKLDTDAQLEEHTNKCEEEREHKAAEDMFDIEEPQSILDLSWLDFDLFGEEQAESKRGEWDFLPILDL